MEDSSCRPAVATLTRRRGKLPAKRCRDSFVPAMFSGSGRTNICHGTGTLINVGGCDLCCALPFVGVCLCLHADDLARVYLGSLCRRFRWRLLCVRAVRCTKITHARNVHVPAPALGCLCAVSCARCPCLWSGRSKLMGLSMGKSLKGVATYEYLRACDNSVHTRRIFFWSLRFFVSARTILRHHHHVWILVLPTRLKS
jgi:hypothetical protein